ncbi:MAG TPA: GntR family transcriptional regulator [Allosphingosinicella sp.]|jgi:hypothetical protein
MEDASRDSFGRAYELLRRKLAEGEYRPGTRLAVDGIVTNLRAISATPVREALSRLAGEGLVESRRKDGYFAPLPTASEIIDLLGMSELYLLAAVNEAAGRSAVRPIAPEWVNLDQEPGPPKASGSENVERETRLLFRSLLLLSESRLLVSSGLATVERLGWPRRVEFDPKLSVDETAAMRTAFDAKDFKCLRHLIRAYHAVRRDAAMRLERALQSVADKRKIGGI